MSLQQQLTNKLIQHKPGIGLRWASEMSTILIRISQKPVNQRTQTDNQICQWLSEVIS